MNSFEEACEAWVPDLTPQPPKPIDVQQVIYALQRARDRLQAEADSHAPDDYSAEFPAEDADRMREAITLLQGLVEPRDPAESRKLVSERAS